MPFIARPNQQEILAYTGGMMGVSAVPGSGKTWTLSRLAAQIIASGELQEDQEVLVVTLVNSAVDNFYQRVTAFVKDTGVLPHMGYRVRTLHSLAHEIVRERPGLLSLADNFQIIDEREADEIRAEVVNAWLRSHPTDLDEYINPDLEDHRRESLRRDRLPEQVREIAVAIIRSAKDMRLTPERLRSRLDQLPLPLPLAELGWAVYADYQRSLAYRGAVDFDDLIRLALDALQQDDGLLQRLRYRWPYILEDEAQDSSLLQEEILSLLAGPDGNWVRVGDPNQAIFETFTTANPKYLRAFVARDDVQARQLPQSGRSTQSIIDLANDLVEWTQSEHPQPEVRDALQKPPEIQPVEAGLEGANPPDDPSQVHLSLRKFTPQEEVQAVVDSIARWLPDHPDSTVAVLAPRNLRGFDVVDELHRRNIPVIDDLLRSSGATRSSAGVLANLLRYLSDPVSLNKLGTVYKVWRRGDSHEPEGKARQEYVGELLHRCARVEDFIWPIPGRDWLEDLTLAAENEWARGELAAFRELVRRWQGTILLPVDQVLLTLAQDLFTEPGELAIAHKLAVLLRHAGEAHPAWRLPELTGELVVIARNERRFLGFAQDDTGFDPARYAGKVAVATLHKAKGLEWDRVYLVSVNNYDFPSGNPQDTYIPEKWFIRDHLNLEAEALDQLEVALSSDEYRWHQPGQATQQARLDYIRERLRLFYVGITRAKKELVITWNTGRRGDCQPATPLVALHERWKKSHPPD